MHGASIRFRGIDLNIERRMIYFLYERGKNMYGDDIPVPELCFGSLPGRSDCCRLSFLSAEDIAGNYHSHDFAELFLVAGGRLRHRVGDAEYLLPFGSAAALAPETAHAISVAAAEPGVLLVNLAFTREALERLERHLGRRLFPAPEAAALHCRFDDRRIAEFRREFSELARSGGERFELERLLMNFSAALRHGGGAGPEAPEWLIRALLAMEEPEAIAAGLPRLRKLAGRDADHLGRTMRRELGISPEEWILEKRLAAAAEELRLSRRPVGEVALRTGFANLSYFHRAFRNRYGETPRRYRLRFSLRLA